MLESSLQNAIKKALEKRGFYVVKLMVTSWNGMPDLLVLNNFGKAAFIEVKTPVGKLTRLQTFIHLRLKLAHHQVFVIRSVEEARDLKF